MHYAVLVVIPPEGRVDELVEHALRPTFNKEWDWFQVGGRWTGLLNGGYDPMKDARNIETCGQCHGTGKRDDKVGQELRKKNPFYLCNGCDGSGKAVKLATEWAPFQGDVQPVTEVLKKQVSFAAIVINGEWIPKPGDWMEENKGWMNVHLEHHKMERAVVVDCHN